MSTRCKHVTRSFPGFPPPYLGAATNQELEIVKASINYMYFQFHPCSLSHTLVLPFLQIICRDVLALYRRPKKFLEDLEKEVLALREKLALVSVNELIHVATLETNAAN